MKKQIGVVMMSQSKAMETLLAEELAPLHLAAMFCRSEFPPPEVPLLVVGDRPVAMMSGDARVTSLSHRGLWIRTATGHMGYVVRDIAELDQVDIEDVDLRGAWLEEWRGDLRRMADRVLGLDAPRDIEVHIYRTVQDAAPLLRRLALHRHPWAFDIETYDAEAFPARKDVSTDPCHGDFRVRGVAVAWGSAAGAWIELMGSEPDAARVYLDPAFTSSAPKWAFNGGFDEEGLTYNGWISEVRNRAGDGMLDMVALSDGRHPALRLERAVVDYLGFPQYWNGIDKSQIRDLPIESVGRSAVEDATATFALCTKLKKRLERGEYFEWPTWIQRAS